MVVQADRTSNDAITLLPFHSSHTTEHAQEEDSDDDIPRMFRLPWYKDPCVITKVWLPTFDIAYCFKQHLDAQKHIDSMEVAGEGPLSGRKLGVT
jgi:hypothetical protein